MVGKTYSATVHGITAQKVEVEADIFSGIPSFELTGNLGMTAREAKDRVRAALRNSGIRLKPSRITVNLSPANIRKEGPHFDLAIAVSVLCTCTIIEAKDIKGAFFLGELGLDGRINPVRAVLPMVMCAMKEGFTRCIVPKENATEAAYIKGIDIIGISTLSECVSFLRGNLQIQPTKSVINSSEETQFNNDYADICGQKALKRAIMVAAASRHNILMIGPPGTGKTMAASRINTIMPPLTNQECMEISGIYSVAGLLNKERPFIDKRPFRYPHNTITATALTGGGTNPVPGEISLAEHGVLFMDEINLFGHNVTESLREPLENKIVTVNRVNGTYRYPADFMLVAAANPCSCGYYPDRLKCTCSEADIKRHFGRLSKPLIDRIDVFIQVSRIEYDEIEGGPEDIYKGSSEYMRGMVKAAYEIQKDRYNNEEFNYNSELPSDKIKKYCITDKDAALLVKTVYDKYEMSARTYHKIMKVARTIADLEGNDKISVNNISEAIGYKRM